MHHPVTRINSDSFRQPRQTRLHSPPHHSLVRSSLLSSSPRCPIRWSPCSRSPTLFGSVTRQARQVREPSRLLRQPPDWRSEEAGWTLSTGFGSEFASRCSDVCTKWLLNTCLPTAGISGRRHLRSADRGHLHFPRVKLASYMEDVHLHTPALRIVTHFLLAVWLSGNALASINVVALRQTRLVLGWVTVCGRVNHFGI